MGLSGKKNKGSLSLVSRYRSFNGYNSMGQKHQMFPGSSAIPGYGHSFGDNYFGQESSNPVAHDTEPDDDRLLKNDFEILRSLELHFKYLLSSRISVTAILPVVSNSQQYNNIETTTSGFGDANIYGTYTIIPAKTKKNSTYRLDGGLGIKLPTGRNDIKFKNTTERINFLLQPGTGSLDAFVFLAPKYNYKRWYVMTNFLYKYNTENNYGERLANSFSNNLSVSHEFQVGKSTIVNPGIHLYHEYTDGEVIDGEQNGVHRSNALIGGPKVELGTGSFIFNAEVGFPLAEKYTAHVSNAGRINIGVSYFFDQKNFLFN